MIERDPSMPAGVLSRCAWLFLCLLGCWTSAAANHEPAAREAYWFDIPSSPRESALTQLGEQAGQRRLRFLGSTEEDGRAHVGPIKGSFSLKDALGLALKDTTLSYRLKGRTIVVEPQPHDEPAVSRVKRTRRSSNPLTLPYTPPPTERYREEVVVHSSLLSDDTNAVVPDAVMERRDLDALGVQSVGEALRYLSQSAFTRAAGYDVSGAQFAEMRGLGPDTVLVLINGRRALPSATTLTSNAFDLNTIPMAAVERIELIDDSSAVAVGTDAIGGIINFVLRQKVTEPTVEIRYGGAAGGAGQRGGTVHLGTNHERYSGTLVLDYFEGSGLLGVERDRWRSQDHRQLGGQDLRSLISAHGTIVSADGRALPGLTAPIAAVPIIDTTPGIGVEDFVPTAGMSNLDSLLKYSSIVPASERKSLVANGSYDINPSLQLSAELLYAARSSTFFLCPPTLAGVPVPASNPFNPFDDTVLAFRLIPELGAQYHSVESQLVRMATGLNARRGDWNSTLSLLYSHDQASTSMHHALDERAVMRAMASPDTTQALNPFQAGALGSEPILRSLVAPRRVDQFVSSGVQIIAQSEGPLTQTRAGPVNLRLGAEWRRESGLFDSYSTGRFDRDRDISSAYLHLHVPLLGKDTARPAVHQLSAAGGIRLDDYDGADSILRAHHGLVWQPLQSLKLQAFQSHSYRPPSLYEMYLPQATTLTTVRDPARNDEIRNITATFGGDDTLKPQTGKTFTAIVAFTPDLLGRPTLSVDYWRITLDDRVSVLSPAVLIENERLFPARTTRADNAEPGGAGDALAPLLAVDATPINAGQLKVSGVDLSLGAELPTKLGHFTPQLRTTWFESFRSTDIPGQRAVERVNLASEAGSILRWRAILSLEWSRGPYRLSTAARYSPAYDDAVAGVRTGRKLTSQTLIDLQGSADLGAVFGENSIGAGFRLTAGAHNLFNVEPALAEVGRVAEFDMSQGDLTNRWFYVRLEKRL